MAWNMEWLNENASRAFPFKEDSRLADVTGGLRIPNNLIVDLCMVVPADFETQFYLSSLVYSGSTVTLVFSTTSSGEFASVSVNTAAHVTNTAYSIVGQGQMSDVRGRITLGDLATLESQMPQGAFSFAADCTAFECRAVRPDIRGVRSIKVIKADGTQSESIYGTIELSEGLNIRLTYVPASGNTPAGIRIDSMATDLETTCSCDASQVRPDPIRTINGIPADNGGNFRLYGEGCLQIAGDTNALTLNDKCAQPCCGCAELEFITQQLEILKTSASALEQRAAELRAAEVNFHNNVLGTLASGV